MLITCTADINETKKSGCAPVGGEGSPVYQPVSLSPSAPRPPSGLEPSTLHADVSGLLEYAPGADGPTAPSVEA